MTTLHGVDTPYPLYIFGASNPQNLALARRCFGTVNGWIDDSDITSYLGLRVHKLNAVCPGARIANCVSADLLARRHIHDRILGRGCEPVTLLDPSATIFGEAVVDGGSYVQENVVVQDGAWVRRNCALHSGCMIGERVTVDSHSFVGPGAVLCGRGKHGESVYFGANCTVLPDVNVGQGATIGAGAVVTKDVAPFVTVIGVPAKPA